MQHEPDAGHRTVNADEGVVVVLSVIPGHGEPARRYAFPAEHGWSVETTATMVIASRYEPSEDDSHDVAPVEVMAWPFAFGGVGVIEIHTGPRDEVDAGTDTVGAP